MQFSLSAIMTIVPLVCSAPVTAGGILPDRVNQIIIDGRFDQPQPQLLVVFSAQPLMNAAGKPMNTETAAELSALATTRTSRGTTATSSAGRTGSSTRPTRGTTWRLRPCRAERGASPPSTA